MTTRPDWNPTDHPIINSPYKEPECQLGSQVLLQAYHHCIIVPAGLGEKALQSW